MRADPLRDGDLDQLRTLPGVQAWTSAKQPSPIFSPNLRREGDARRGPIAETDTAAAEGSTATAAQRPTLKELAKSYNVGRAPISKAGRITPQPIVGTSEVGL